MMDVNSFPECLRASIHSSKQAANLASPASESSADRCHVFRNSLLTMTAVAALLVLQRPAFAAPTGGNVVAGQANIQQSGNTTNINQSSNKAIINWQGFSIGSGETVNFNQPGASSATLNRVIGNEKSIIAGALNANGQVFIVNSAGVLFTKGAQVNVGGLVASTLDISNQNFMAGNYTFHGDSDASIINKGHIHTKNGGYVALLGKRVTNDGVITAKLGTVAMASGDKITLNFGGNSLVDVTIDKGTMNAMVQNKHLIKADGGTVIMTAKAADDILSAQVKNTGIIQARTMASLMGGSSTSTVHVGTIKLLASGGTVHVAGKLDASAPKGGNGGTIETSGNKATVANNAIITTKSASGRNGTWTIDPTNFTIVSGSGAQTASGIGATTLDNNLALGNVIIETAAGGTDAGDINVNAPVLWSSANSLTLTAANSIFVNAVFTAPAGTLNLNAGTDININAPSSVQVAALNATATGNVNINAAQTWANNGTWTFNGTNINVNDTVNWSNGTLTFNAGYSGGVAGVVSGYINVNAPMTASNNTSFVATYNTGMDTSTDGSGNPTATYGTPLGGFNFLFDISSWSFTGKLNFLSNDTAANPLTINGNPYTLITSIGGSGPHDASVINNDYNNGVTGYYALASDLTVTSTTFSGAPIAGIGSGAILEGLGHTVKNVTINNTDADNQFDGLIALNLGTILDINLTNVSVTEVSSYIGALVGGNAGNIINSYASGTVNVTAFTNGPTGGYLGQNYVGGLTGYNEGIIYGSQANVAVTTTDVLYVGGFVGLNTAFSPGQGIILNSASYGAVNVSITNQNSSSANQGLDGGFGGFAGTNESGTISNSSSSGAVTATAGTGAPDIEIQQIGGFIGNNNSLGGDGANGVINNSVSTSPVTTSGAASAIGGFIGLAQDSGSIINNSAAFGKVQAGPGASAVGGFLGFNNGGTLNGDTFNQTTTGQTNSTGFNYSTVATASATTVTGPSSTQGPAPSTGAQTAAAARAQAQTLVRQLTPQQTLSTGASQAGTPAPSTGTPSTAPSQATLNSAATGAIASTTTNTALAAVEQPIPFASSSAGTEAITALTSPLQDLLPTTLPATTPLPTQTERRRHAANTTRHGNGGNGGGGLGATIRNIEINGQQFNLGH